MYQLRKTVCEFMVLCGSVPGSVVLKERNKDTKGPGSNLNEIQAVTANKELKRQNEVTPI